MKIEKLPYNNEKLKKVWPKLARTVVHKGY